MLMYPDSDFIPYACYIDKNTILTKNTDLISIIKIPSFISNKAEIDLFDIREQIRLSLMAHYKNQNISFYFTTVRKKEDIIPNHTTNSLFDKETSEMWNKQNNWYDQYVNEIYITIIISPEINTNLLNPVFFLTSLTQTGINRMYSKKIDQANKVLKKFIKTIFPELEKYGAQLLTMTERDGVVYSDHMRFFSLLINLEKDNFPITYDDISDVIRLKKMAYGSDIIETDKKGEKKFASVLTVKSFQELTLSQIDKILQLPIEIVITETCNFTDPEYVETLYKEQKEMVSLSEDMDLAYISGLDSLVSTFSNKPTDFCIGQTSIMVINSTKGGLIDNLKDLYKAFDTIGLVAIKENVFLPTIFWSQLPANFRYLKRLHITPYNKLANFASMYNFPTGKFRNNYWGNAITIIPTALKTPYFFNFHFHSVGHTLIVGLKETGKTTIMNFLISQATKLNPKILYIDTQRSSEVFINAIGGKYFKISPNLQEEEILKLNPFMLDNTENNINILSKMVEQMVEFQDDGFIEMGKSKTQLKTEFQHIPKIVKQILSLNKEERLLSKVIELFNTPETKLIHSKLSFWTNETNSFIFNHDNLYDFKDNIIGISLKTIIDNPNITLPITYLLLHIVKLIADGKPFIFAIDNAWEILNNPVIAPIFTDMLDNISKQNVAVIVTTSGNTKVSESALSEPMTHLFATQIYFGVPKLSLYQKKVFCLQEEEGRILSLMKIEDRNFLLKCLKDTIIASINLKDFGYYTRIFANDNVSINAMKKAKATSQSNDPSVWIPAFIKILDDYTKVVAAKKLKETEINQMKWEESISDENSRNKIVNSKE